MVPSRRMSATDQDNEDAGGIDNAVAEAIDSIVRPLVEADGGAIELVSISQDEVVVKLAKACAGCPGAPFTKAEVIEPVVTKAAGRPLRVKLVRGARIPKSSPPTA